MQWAITYFWAKAYQRAAIAWKPTLFQMSKIFLTSVSPVEPMLTSPGSRPCATNEFRFADTPMGCILALQSNKLRIMRIMFISAPPFIATCCRAPLGVRTLYVGADWREWVFPLLWLGRYGGGLDAWPTGRWVGNGSLRIFERGSVARTLINAGAAWTSLRRRHPFLRIGDNERREYEFGYFEMSWNFISFRKCKMWYGDFTRYNYALLCEMWCDKHRTCI